MSEDNNTVTLSVEPQPQEFEKSESDFWDGMRQTESDGATDGTQTDTPPTESSEGTDGGTEDGNSDIESRLKASLGEDAPTDAEKDIETKPEEGDEKPPDFSRISEDFKKATGVDISEAYENIQKFNEASTQVLEQISTAQAVLAQQQQRFEVMVALGKPPQEVDSIIGQCVQAYSTLSPELRQRLASMGSQGVLAIWEQIKPKEGGVQAPSTPNPNQANIASAKETVSETDLFQLPEDQFWNVLRGNS